MNKKNEFIAHQKKDKQIFFERILENCYIDHLSDNFHCKRCKAVGHVDWYRNLAPLLIIGALISVPFSTFIVKKLPTRSLKVSIGLLTLILGMVTLIKIYLILIRVNLVI